MDAKFLLSTILAVTSISFAYSILVTTPKGKILGRRIISPGNKTFYAFTGVPFAKSPTGKLRFQAPVEPESWQGILNATTDPRRCFQVNFDSDEETEDCLFINIFTPALDLVNTSKKLPVALGHYGGAFRSGAAYYGTGGPDWFVERDIVIVTFNYRVGPMGFLSTGDTIIPGNAGIKDQQFALKWTYDNIEHFGGDKHHITIYGQSAGAASVTYQLLNKKNEGLIVGALAQSGSALCAWAWSNDNLDYTIKLATIINNNTELANTSSAFLLAFLQNATARQVDAASAVLYPKRLPLPTVEPEHEGAFITEPMYEALAAGHVVKVPLLIGINSEEDISQGSNLANLQARAKQYDENVNKLAPSVVAAENRTIAGKIIKATYVGNDTFSHKLGAAIGFISDTQFSRANIRFGEMFSKWSPVYFYQFSYKGPMGKNMVYFEGADNVAHGEENYYLSVSRGVNYDNTKYDKFPQNDVLTHWRMIEMWSNFYKYRNPTPEPAELLANLTWPRATAENFVYLNINKTLEIKDTPKSPRYNAWRYVYEVFGVRPFYIY